MKKFLSKILFAAVAILSVAGFTSCNNSDDDPYVPAQASVQEQPKYEEVSAYAAVISENLLSMYDIKLVLHSGDQSKEVELTKANGEAKEYNDNNAKTTYYKYLYSNIDGKKGIDRVEAMVTPKADIKTILKSMPEERQVMIYGAGVFKAVYDANGKLMGEVGKKLGEIGGIYTPSQMLMDMGEGTLVYDYQAETIEVYLTR